MISSDNFPVNFEISGRRYLLSKTELRAIDTKDEKRSYAVPLNELNPNFYHRIRVSLFMILSTAYFSVGLLIGLFSLLTGSTYFTTTPISQIAICFAILSLSGYRLYQASKDYPYYYFHSLTENDKSYAIAFTRKEKQQTLEFIKLVAKRVREATLSNRTIINLLGSYHLLTQIEWSQLDASIKQKEVSGKTNESVIINLQNRKS